MSQISSLFGNLPGMGTVVETYEAAITWGPAYNIVWWNGLISSAAIDSGNTPTYRLRPGLLLGLISATGLWTNYSPTATDGSEVASGVLAYGMTMQDYLLGSTVQKFFAIVVGGRVKGANLLNINNMARNQMSPRFIFDDNLIGGQWFPFNRFQTKATSYVVTAADNFTMFDNTGAIGTVVLTLPAIAAGYMFGLRCQAAQVFRFTSAEGGNVVGTTATDTSASVTAIGGVIWIYSNAAGTKWIVEQHGTQTITIA